jgi:cytochrome P450
LARPRIEALAERLLDEIEANGPTADLISDFTTPLAYTVICEMVGVPISDLGTFRIPNDMMMSTMKKFESRMGNLLADRSDDGEGDQRA